MWYKKKWYEADQLLSFSCFCVSLALWHMHNPVLRGNSYHFYFHPLFLRALCWFLRAVWSACEVLGNKKIQGVVKSNNEKMWCICLIAFHFLNINKTFLNRKRPTFYDLWSRKRTNPLLLKWMGCFFFSVRNCLTTRPDQKNLLLSRIKKAVVVLHKCRVGVFS